MANCLLNARLLIPRGNDHRTFDRAWRRAERRQRGQSSHPPDVPERGQSPNEEQRCCGAKDKSACIDFDVENMMGLSAIGNVDRYGKIRPRERGTPTMSWIRHVVRVMLHAAF